MKLKHVTDSKLVRDFKITYFEMSHDDIICTFFFYCLVLQLYSRKYKNIIFRKEQRKQRNYKYFKSEKIKIVICCIEKGYVFYKNVSALYVPLTYLFTHSVLYGSMY